MTPVAFDYDVLSPVVAALVASSAERIRDKVKRSLEDIISVGQELVAVKEALPHGQFGLWLDAEFGWKVRAAQTFMSVAESFGPKSATIAHLAIQPTAAYLLAAPSVPEQAREAAIERAALGEEITVAVAKEIVQKARPPRTVRQVGRGAGSNEALDDADISQRASPAPSFSPALAAKHLGALDEFVSMALDRLHDVDVGESKELRADLQLFESRLLAWMEGGTRGWAVPPSLDTPEFRGLWDDWMAHRTEKSRKSKSKLTVRSLKQAMNNLAEMGLERACAALKHTTGNGWDGIREPEQCQRADGKPSFAKPTFDEKFAAALAQQEEES